MNEANLVDLLHGRIKIDFHHLHKERDNGGEVRGSEATRDVGKSFQPSG